MKPREQKSVLLITVDCLRADHVGFMGYPRPTTPFLDGLARESMVFPKAIVTGAPTYYAFPGLLASRYPLSLGREVVGIAPGEPTLATVLQQAGYATAGFVAANPYLSARFGYEQGFEVFRDFAPKAPPPESANENLNHGGHRGHGGVFSRLNPTASQLAHKLPALGKLYDELYFQYRQRISSAKRDWGSLRRFPTADVLVDEACHWLETLGHQPFFLWLHFMDSHAPYYPTEKGLAAMHGGNLSPARACYLNEIWKRGDLGPRRLRKYRDEIVSLYNAGIRSVDMQLARLADCLQVKSVWDSCVFVATADHGEEFLDHGGVFHSPARTYQEMLQVPLLIRVPGFQQKLSATPFSHLDLAPTVLDAIGIESPAEFEGRSYWRELQAGGGWEMAISESVARCTNPMDAEKRMGGRILVVQDERHKLVLDFERGSEEHYDLATDPREQNCLSSEADRDIRKRMLLVAREHLSRGGKSNPGYALRARLREIGLEWKHTTTPAETLTKLSHRR